MAEEHLCPSNFVFPPTLHILEQTDQVQGIHALIRLAMSSLVSHSPPPTIHDHSSILPHAVIRSKDTHRDDFIFYSKRLMRLLIENAMSMLPFKSVTVTTPQGFLYEGKSVAAKQVRICPLM